MTKPVTDVAEIARGRSSDSPERLVRMPELVQRTGLSRTTIYRRVAAGTFPRPVAIGENSVGWYDSALREWMASPMEFRAAA